MAERNDELENRDRALGRALEEERKLRAALATERARADALNKRLDFVEPAWAKESVRADAAEQRASTAEGLLTSGQALLRGHQATAAAAEERCSELEGLLRQLEAYLKRTRPVGGKHTHPNACAVHDAHLDDIRAALAPSALPVDDCATCHGLSEVHTQNREDPGDCEVHPCPECALPDERPDKLTTRRVKVLEDMLAGARMTIAGLRAAAQGPELIAEAVAAHEGGLSEGPDDDVLDHAAEESHPPIRPGAKCSNGDEFWCPAHCPINVLTPDRAPGKLAGQNCYGERPRCSEHCTP